MSTTTARSTSPATKARVLIAIMLFITVVINYMDRANLSIAMPAISGELDLSKAQQGLLLSAFGWTYAALQIRGGWLVDRVPPRVLYPACLALWSLATIFMGIIGGFVALIILRLMVGTFEAHVDLAERRTERAAVTRADIATVLGRRKLWGTYLGQFCLTSTLWFVLTWFPTYLVEYRDMDYIKSGFLASLPFMAALIGVLFSGVFSDFLLRRGFSLRVACKGPIITGLLLTTAMLVIVFLSIALFGNGLASITWSLVSALAPTRLIGLTGGMFNFIGNLSSIATPIIIGLIVTDASFAPGFFYMTVITTLGIASYVLLVGRVERVPDPADAIAAGR
jgi:sugar phosphate permease